MRRYIVATRMTIVYHVCAIAAFSNTAVVRSIIPEIDWMRNLHGNTHGLKPNQLRRIEKLYQRRISPRQIVTPEFARQLS